MRHTLSSQSDVFYIHFPVALEYIDPKVGYPHGWKNTKGEIIPGSTSIQETWQAMERLVDIGLVDRHLKFSRISDH
jgi:D-xylose reductase